MAPSTASLITSILIPGSFTSACSAHTPDLTKYDRKIIMVSSGGWFAFASMPPPYFNGFVGQKRLKKIPFHLLFDERWDFDKLFQFLS
jgi:hypothetical protein